MPFAPMTIQWEAPPPLHPDAGPPFLGLQERDLAVLYLLGESRYIHADHLTPLGYTYHKAYERLSQLEQYGWTQHAKFRFPDQRTGAPHNVYALTEQGVTWLRLIDPDWDQAHPDFHGPAGIPLLRNKVYHELLRTSAAQHLVQTAHTAQLDADWRHGSAGSVRGYPYGPQGVRLTFVPDAVLYVHDQIWLMELERSWRTSTIAIKSKHYLDYFASPLWQQQFPRLPRVLFVLTQTSTQENTLLTWLQQASVLHTPHAWMTLYPQMLQHDPVMLSRMDPQGAGRVLTASWIDVQTQAGSR